MPKDRKFRYFIQQFIPRFYVICRLLTEVSQISASYGIISQELIDIFIKATWVRMNIKAVAWAEFIAEKSEEMMRSNKVYVTYVLFICQLLNDNISDIFDRFLSVISLVMTFSVNFYHLGNRNYHNFSSKILIVFFENMMKEEFYQKGGWNKLETFLSELQYLDWYVGNESFNDIGVAIFRAFADEHLSVRECFPYVSLINSITQKDVDNNLICLQLAEEVLSQEETATCHKSTSTGKSPAENASKILNDTLDLCTESHVSNDLEKTNSIKNSYKLENSDSPSIIKLDAKDKSNSKSKIKRECYQMLGLDPSATAETSTDEEEVHLWDCQQNKNSSTSAQRGKSVTPDNRKIKSPMKSKVSPQSPSKESSSEYISKQAKCNKKCEISNSVQQRKVNANDIAEQRRHLDPNHPFSESFKVDCAASPVVSNNEFMSPESEFLVLSKAKHKLDSLKKKLNLLEDMLNYLLEQ